MGAVQFNDSTRGYAHTLAPAGKFPIVGDRIFNTLQAAQDYVDGNGASKTAIPGIYLSVIDDGDNNGAYWVAQAAGYNGATSGLLQKMGEGGGGTGGGGIDSIEFSLESNATYAVSLTINKVTKNITAATLKSSLGLKELAYKQMSDVLGAFSQGEGLAYSNGKFSLASLHTSGSTHTKITYDKYGRVTSGSALAADDIPSLTISKISDLSTELQKYVLVSDYEADINDATNGLAAKVAALEEMFTFNKEQGYIETKYNFYSTKQLAGGGRPGAITNLVNVVPNYSEGTLVATINGTEIYAPTSGGGVSVNPVYTSGNKIASINGVDIYAPESSGGGSGLWYDYGGDVTTDNPTTINGTLTVNNYVQTYDLDVFGWLCVEDGAEVYEDLTIYGTFNVFEYGAYIENDLTVDGDVFFGGRLDIQDLSICNERGWEGSVLMCDSDGYPYWADLPAGSSISLATLATTYASGNLSAAITFAGNDSYGIFTATNNYGSIGSSSKRFYCGYINNLYAYSALYIGGTTSYFSSKTTAIASTSTDYQIPSAKSVYTFVNEAIANVGGGSYTLPLASSSERGGIKIGASGSSSIGSYVYLPLILDLNEKAYVSLTKSSITTALGYTPSQEGSGGGSSANPILTLASINGKTTTVPNGISSVEVTSAATLNLKGVTPEDTSKTCILQLVKSGSYALSIPLVSTSKVVAVSTSGAVATAAVTLSTYAGCTIIWNSTNSNWVAYL